MAEILRAVRAVLAVCDYEAGPLRWESAHSRVIGATYHSLSYRALRSTGGPVELDVNSPAEFLIRMSLRNEWITEWTKSCV